MMSSTVTPTKYYSTTIDSNRYNWYVDLLRGQDGCDELKGHSGDIGDNAAPVGLTDIDFMK